MRTIRKLQYVPNLPPAISATKGTGEAGLIAYFPFNGDVGDKSGNNHEAAAYKAKLTRDRFFQDKRALFFIGDVGTPNENRAAFAWVSTDIEDDIQGVSLWFSGLEYVHHPDDRPRDCTHGLGSFGGLVSQHSTDDDGFQFRREGNKNNAEIKIDSVDYAIPEVRYDRNWHHVIFTTDGTSTKVYCDARLVKTIAASWKTAGRVTIGSVDANERNRNGGSHKGSIDDVRIYNRPLSDSDVARLFRCRD